MGILGQLCVEIIPVSRECLHSPCRIQRPSLLKMYSIPVSGLETVKVRDMIFAIVDKFECNVKTLIDLINSDLTKNMCMLSTEGYH